MQLKENFKVLLSESVTTTKIDGRQVHKKQTSHFAVRYVVLQYCHSGLSRNVFVFGGGEDGERKGALGRGLGFPP